MRGKAGLIATAALACIATCTAMAYDGPDAPAKDADNTARNAADKSGGTLTPIDQGTSEADIAMTAQIRKEIVAAKNMSVIAQNVKIITNVGKVTLRGPVETSEEKRRIVDIATKHAKRGNVDDQLEVKVAMADKPKGD